MRTTTVERQSLTSNYAVTDPRTGEIHSTYASMTDAELAACVRRSVAAGRELGRLAMTQFANHKLIREA